MAELFTVKRGDEVARVTVKELAKYKKRGFKEVGTKRITTETGERTVESKEARRRLRRGEATGFVSDAEIEGRYREQAEEERYGGTAETVQTFGESALSSLTFGLSDPLTEKISELSEGDAGAVAKRQEINPYAATAGSVTGSIVGALAGPGSIARFTPAGLAARGAAKAGAAVGARTGSKVAQYVTEGVVDGALFGAGQAYANAVINDDPVNAEKIIAEMGSGALFGGAVSGAVGGLGKLAKRLETKRVAREAAEAAIKKADDVTPMVSKRIIDDYKNAIPSLDPDLVPRAREIMQRVDGAFNKNLSELSPETMGILLDDISEFSAMTGKQVNLSGISGFDELVKKHPKILDSGEEATKLLSDALPEQTHKITPSNEVFAKLYASQKAQQATAAVATSKSAPGLFSKLKDMAMPAAMGAVGGPMGMALGVMSKSIRSSDMKIADGIEKFARFAGKQRRGTVPAATTILGKIRFDGNVGAKPEKGRTEQFKARAKEIQALQQNPELVKQNVHNALKDHKTLKPGLADQMTAVAMQRINLLSSVLPKSSSNTTFGPDRWKPSQTEIDKFARIARAAEDPYSILDDLNAGKLTQEAVDTVKQLYPGIYQEIQMEIINNVDDIKANVDYKGRIQLGILFQVPTDDVLDPAFIQMMQQNYLMREQEREQQGGGNFSTPGNLQKSLTNQQTSSQRIESK